ncbi:MAG: potassium/proton antiporter [Sporichthyaceae bacterium]|nr:potassium/proton antiporter [Sporichthyaceae bacterium]
MTIEQLDYALLVGAAALLVAAVAVRISARTGLPSLLLYLCIGVILGEDVLGMPFDDFELARSLGYAALVVILAEGGLATRWVTIRPVLRPTVSLSTIGIGISIGITAVAAHWLLDVEWQLAFLVAAILAPTDAAAIFSVLRRLPLPRRLSGLLEAESGFNDPPTILLVVALSAAPGESGPFWEIALLIVYQLIAGAVVGLAVGRGGAWALRRVALPASGLYPIAVFALTVFAYAVAAELHSSGFLATYVAALVLGNSRLPHSIATRGFVDGLAWIAQIGLFIMIGLLADPSDFGAQIVPALLLGAVLLLVARPAAVVLSTLPFGFTWREQALLSWAGLRGAVPIVLATVPVVSGVPDSQRLFNLVFILVVIFTIVQGPTLPWVARWLRLGANGTTRDVELDVAPLGEFGADVLTVRIPDDSALHGVEVFELRLPPGAVLSLIVRDGRHLVPGGSTVLRHGDELLVVTTARSREQAERRLLAVSREGRLAGWYGPGTDHDLVRPGSDDDRKRRPRRRVRQLGGGIRRRREHD